MLQQTLNVYRYAPHAPGYAFDVVRDVERIVSALKLITTLTPCGLRPWMRRRIVSCDLHPLAYDREFNQWKTDFFLRGKKAAAPREGGAAMALHAI